MNEIREVVLGFCAAAVFLGALSIISPGGSSKKPIKYILSLIFLASCVTLFLGAGKITAGQIPTEVAPCSGVAKMGAIQAEYLCRAVLADNGISFNKVCAETNINESGDIYINVVRVYSSNKGEEIEEVIKKKLTVKHVEVINE